MPPSLAEIVFTSDTAAAVANNDKLQNSVKGIAGQVQGFVSNLKNLAGAYVSVRAAQELLELGQLGEQLADVRSGFDRLTGDGPQNLDRVRVAVNGVVDDLVLMRTTSAALAKGLNMDQVAIAFRFAKQRADDVGDAWEGTADRVTTALARLIEGTGDAARSLVPLGIYGRDVNEVLRNMVEYTDRAKMSGAGASDTWDQFAASLRNWRNELGEFVATVAGPAVAAINAIGESVRRNAGLSVKPTLTFVDKDGKPLEGDALLQAQLAAGVPAAPVVPIGQTTNLRQFISGIEDAGEREKVLALLTAEATLAGNTQLEIARNLLEVLELQGEALVEQNATDQQMAPLLVAQKNLRLQIADLEKQTADQAETERKKAITDDQARLNTDRALVKAKIALGEDTYDHLAELVRKHKELYKDDLNFQIGILNDQAAIYQANVSTREKAESEYLNHVRDVNTALLRDTRTTEAQKLAAQLQLWKFVSAKTDLDADHRRQVRDEVFRAEDQLTNYIYQESQRRVQILEQVFGQPFLSALDRLFMGGKLKFEDFLRDLTRSIVHFLMQTALHRFFAILAGSLFPPMLPGFSKGNYSSITSMPGQISSSAGSILSGLSAGMSSLIPRPPAFIHQPSSAPASASVNLLPAPVHVQILATADGLAATVRHGERILARTDLS